MNRRTGSLKAQKRSGPTPSDPSLRVWSVPRSDRTLAREYPAPSETQAGEVCGPLCMSESRSAKLLLLGGAHVPVESLAPLLREHYEVLSVSPEDAAEALRRSDVKAVFADTGDFLPIERGLLDHRAASLLNSIGEGVALFHPSGECVWTNDRFRLYSERMQARIAAICTQRAGHFKESFSADSASHLLFTSKHELSEPDGDRHYELALSPVLSLAGDGKTDGEAAGADPALEAVAAVVFDVTTSRRMQQKIDAIDRAGRELMRFDVESVRGMNAAERLALLQDRIVQFAHELLHFDHFTIRLLDRESGRLDLVMSLGLPSECAERELRAERKGYGIIGHVAATGRSYICSDTSKDPLYLPGLRASGSSLTVPLQLTEPVIGVFNIESSRLDAFSDDDRRFAEIFGRYVAMALHILDLLVVERSSTNEDLSGRVVGEVSEPLEDLANEAEWLRGQASADPEAAMHVDRIIRDVESIRRRIRDVARGPRTILGAERALREEGVEPGFSGRRVLVADDEPTIRETIRDVLERRGCEVVISEDGAKAITELEAAREAISAGADPARRGFDLVVSDIKMPDRNGYEVFAAAKLLDRDMPVILMTGFGYDPHHSIVRASQEGLQCVLFKPFRIERLLEEVRKAITSADEETPAEESPDA
ncbi:MAG: response regulator [Phycisphaeraceae bacterium]|nr:MAG: response regulator [Phycisphaeraceae bacterium]